MRPTLRSSRAPKSRGCEIEVAIQNPGRYGGLGIVDLRRWLVELMPELAPQADTLGVRFASDREMRCLNRLYRGQDRATDVLSFSGEETRDGSHLGDVLISVTTARRQAVAGGRPLQIEIRSLVLHGVLHCLGYDHETDNGAMNRIERRLRRRWIKEDA